MSWQDAFSRPGTPFGERDPRFYGPQGHRGQDYYRGRGETMPAYERGRVALIERSSGIGYCVSIESFQHGDFYGFAHGIDLGLRVGEIVEVGRTLAAVAGPNDRPGTIWAGAHIHTTRGPRADHIFSGTVTDPRPFILAATAGSAAAGTLPTPVQEAIMANGGALIRNNTPGYKFQGKPTFGAVALVGLGFVNPQASMEVVNALVPVFGPVIELSGDQYHTVIRECQANDAGKPGIV